MLKKFNEQLPSILQSFPSMPAAIHLPNNFARLILIGAKNPTREVDHRGERTTRDGYDPSAPSFNTRIEIDFDRPQPSVFSATFADIKHANS